MAERLCGVNNPNGGGCSDVSDTTCDGDGTESEACNTNACSTTTAASTTEDCSVGKVSCLV